MFSTSIGARYTKWDPTVKRVDKRVQMIDEQSWRAPYRRCLIWCSAGRVGKNADLLWLLFNRQNLCCSDLILFLQVHIKKEGGKVPIGSRGRKGSSCREREGHCRRP